MKSEDQARIQIDTLLEQAGWIIQDKDRLNLGVGGDVAIREFQVDSGPAVYLLFVNREAVGTSLTDVESQGAC